MLRLRLWGDEFVHGWETLDGYSVQRDQRDGYWEYARRNRQGLLVPSLRVYNELIDTNGDSVGDTAFLTVIANAEAVRLNPASTKAQIIAQKNLLERIDLDQA